MQRNSWSTFLFPPIKWLLISCTVGYLFVATANVGTPATVNPLHVLIVGGGPDKENNQVAIESNVRYVGRLLPPGTVHTTLFADGNPRHATVLYDEDMRALAPARQLLTLLLSGREGAADASHYRPPNLGLSLDGAARLAPINNAFTQLAHDTASNSFPVLLYFTGHGSPDDADKENNKFDLWDGEHKGEALSVRQLAQQVARLPANVPVTLVMVQCFAGSFGNLLFEGGDPQGQPIKRDLAGFFATVKDHMAAGCTSAVNEAEYHDFTSYFFAALTGRDRMGRAITGADYNHDGRVGMDEAYCYTLSHDVTIDIPVCTSDVFLRRWVKGADTKIFQIPYSDVQAWATPAQRAALEALSRQLHLSGDGRLDEAYRNLSDMPSSVAMDKLRRGAIYQRNLHTIQHFDALRLKGRRALLRQWPALRTPGTKSYTSVENKALAALTRQIKAGRWQDLLSTAGSLDKAVESMESQEAAESYLVRFVRLCKSVVLAHNLQEHGDPALQARFNHLVELEGQTLLSPATSTPR
ncbi:MAG: hypothetical protein JO316_19555 [Abitibacteriaceae bacterium]|nr:hypothetical protein [Abditibacteriaceae bacterium]